MMTFRIRKEQIQITLDECMSIMSGEYYRYNWKIEIPKDWLKEN